MLSEAAAIMVTGAYLKIGKIRVAARTWRRYDDSCGKEKGDKGLSQRKRMKKIAIIVGCVWLLIGSCTADRSKRDVAGPYNTWNEVIERWIGGKISDLYVELGPPNLHPHKLENGMTEMVWDYAVDRMPGQADYYDMLPLSLYGGTIDCQVHFFADAEGIVKEGHLVGCQ
ncbi:MAG: hypothetical protein ABI980_00835 [Nitrospirota bacterium]